jgi:hypothetical protein
MTARNMNPFVKTRSMCSGQEEDHLTEFIAGALGACEEFRTAYRKRFLAVCGLLTRFRWKAILIKATLEDIKGGLDRRRKGGSYVHADDWPEAVSEGALGG